MSQGLRKAVEKIVEKMDRECEVADGDSGRVPVVAVRYFADQLRLVLDASEPELENPFQERPGAIWQRAAMERAEALEKRKQADAQERVGESFAYVEDGPVGSDIMATMVPVTGMPENAFTLIDGLVYQLRGGKLYYHEQQTEQVRALRKGGGS